MPEFCLTFAQSANEPLLGTAQRNACHFVMAAPKSSWAARPEEMDGAIGSFARLVEPLKGQAIFSLIHGEADGTVWLFPHGYRFEKLAPEQYEQLIESVLNGEINLPHVSLPPDERWILVCTHGKRDLCCGKWGAPVLQALRDAASLGLHVWESSHLGGHRFAGTMVVHPFNHWYGWVTPPDVPELLGHITKGEVLRRLYRGNANYPPPLQVAEDWAWQRLQERGTHGKIELVNPSISGESASVEVSLNIHNDSQTYRLFLKGEAYTFIADTDSPKTKDRLIWQVVGVQNHGQDY